VATPVVELAEAHLELAAGEDDEEAGHG
jgi:hypothetical protein